MAVHNPCLEELIHKMTECIDAKEGQLIRPRAIITLSGIPGSGKTTLAAALVTGLNKLANETRKNYKAIAIPMDGYHLPRNKLDAEGLRRRGAPFTFDADGVLELIKMLRISTYRNLPTESGAILAPSFDHALKDPIMDDISIPRSTNIIVLEGNYLLLDDLVWRDISGQVDASWFLECSFAVAKERLAKRHVAAGICSTLEEGIHRVEFNDEPNGRYLVEHSLLPTLRITQVS